MKNYIILIAALCASCQRADRQPVAPSSGSMPLASTSAVVLNKVEPAPCADEVNGAVLNKLYPALSDASQADSLRELDRVDYRISCIREWAGGLKDECLRDNYISWLDYYGERSKRSRAKVEEGKPPVDHWQEEYEKKQRAIRQYEATHKVPAPPQECESDLIKRIKP